MKKLLTAAFAFAAFVTFASNADAQTNRHNRVNQQTQYKRTNQRGVRVYNQEKIVRRNGQQYRETYQVKVQPNGKTTSKLISRVKINNNRSNAAGRTSYQTKVVRKGRYQYRETYQVTTYRNGRTTSKLVSSKRIN